MSSMAAALAAAKREEQMSVTHFDTARKYVRLSQYRADGLVEFEFAVGEPELYVELVLPRPAFADFCLAHQVILLEPKEPEAGPVPDWDWRMQQASRGGLRKR